MPSSTHSTIPSKMKAEKNIKVVEIEEHNERTKTPKAMSLVEKKELVKKKFLLENKKSQKSLTDSFF